jgi:hypothetical protein
MTAVHLAEAMTRAKLRELRLFVQHLEQNATTIEYLATLGGVFELEGRSRWLAAVRQRLALDSDP